MLIDLSLAAPRTTRYSYPEPVDVTEETFNVCGVDQELQDNANALYELLNYELPLDGGSTWINKWVLGLDQTFIDSSNALYELENQDLPISGPATWWNLW